MAVHYMFKTDTGTHERRLQIPESSDEKVHGETYDQEVIDSLHASEKQNIEDLVNLRSAEYGEKLGKVWAEKVTKEWLDAAQAKA